jgi:hypothetical protein
MVHWWAAGSLWQRESEGEDPLSFLPNGANELFECVCVCVFFWLFLFLSGISSDAVAKFEGGKCNGQMDEQ